MAQNIGRRKFIQAATATGAYAAAARRAEATAANNRLVVGVMGLSRGTALAKRFAAKSDISVRYVCDVDQRRIRSCLANWENSPPKGISDFRTILDDPQVDALICAAPNHWHACASIMACQAGKHVYVEKPCSQTPAEGEWMISAARQQRRVVQVGTQRRSSPGTQRAIALLQQGTIGDVYLARCWYQNARGSIGKRQPSLPPAELDYDLWQGPAPRRPFKDNVVHYNWHWHWHWGNGELGNNGVHAIDLCRWGLGVAFPTRVTSSGGRFAFDDDQQTPDTHTVCFEFPHKKAITWHGLSCNKHGDDFVTFYGTSGTLRLSPDGKYQVFDRGNHQVAEHTESNVGEVRHIDNFVDCVRNNKADGLNAEIEEGHRSALLCHLGNIAHRTGSSLNCDPRDGTIVDNAEASRLWSREYVPDWEPRVQT